MIILLDLIIFTIVFLTGVVLVFKFCIYNQKADYVHYQQLTNYQTSGNNIGRFEQNETLTILNLCGSYSEMGKQYGALVHNQLHEIYQKIVPEYFEGISARSLLSYILRLYYQFKIDDRERELLQGMVKTSGLSYQQLLSIEMLPMLITLYSGFNGDKLTDDGGSGHCSFLSVWGNLSKTGSMLIARNLDLSTAVTKLDPYYSLVIYKPSGNDNSVASFGFLGFIPGFTWINDKGLFSEYNDGRRSVPGFNLSGYIGLNTAFYAMLEAKNSAEFIQYVNNHPAFVSNFNAIVDINDSFTIEHAVKTKPVILKGQKPEANFFTNLYRANFEHAKLTMNNCVDRTRDTPSYASVRYHNIKSYLTTIDKIGVSELKQLFSTPLDDGGVYQTGNSSNYPVAEVTNYTLIGELATGKFIYSNHRNKDIWLEININDYFKK